MVAVKLVVVRLLQYKCLQAIQHGWQDEKTVTTVKKERKKGGCLGRDNGNSCIKELGQRFSVEIAVPVFCLTSEFFCGFQFRFTNFARYTENKGGDVEEFEKTSMVLYRAPSVTQSLSTKIVNFGGTFATVLCKCRN